MGYEHRLRWPPIHSCRPDAPRGKCCERRHAQRRRAVPTARPGSGKERHERSRGASGVPTWPDYLADDLKVSGTKTGPVSRGCKRSHRGGWSLEGNRRSPIETQSWRSRSRPSGGRGAGKRHRFRAQRPSSPQRWRAPPSALDRVHRRGSMPPGRTSPRCSAALPPIHQVDRLTAGRAGAGRNQTSHTRFFAA